MKRILLLSGCLFLSIILMSCAKKKDDEIPTNEESRIESSGQSMDKDSQTVQNTVNSALMLNMAGSSTDEVISEETAIVSIEFTYYETDPGTEKEMVIDTAVIDVDNDGIPEDWSMTFGPTSGLFTVVITASQDGNIKYKNTFNMIWGHKLFFDEKDGSPCIVRMILGDNGEERTEYLNMYVREGRIVLDGLDTDYEGYWGDAAWNYDLKSISECSPAELFERMMYSPAWSSNPGE